MHRLVNFLINSRPGNIKFYGHFLTVKKDGVTHLLPQGVELIGKSFMEGSGVKDNVEHGQGDGAKDPDIKALLDRLNRLEGKYIETLKEQIREKDELIRE